MLITVYSNAARRWGLRTTVDLNFEWDDLTLIVNALVCWALSLIIDLDL